MPNLKEYILANKLGTIYENASFKNLTTLGIGGLIKYLYIPNSISSLIKSYKYIFEHNIKFFIIGNGSNILVDDKYFDGIVISLRKLNNFSVIEDILKIEAGASYIDLVYLLKNNIGGFEEIATIPGTIGGMIYGNAGCFKKEISDILIDVTFIDSNGNIKTIENKDLNFGYRYSIFKENKFLILSATFKINHNSDYNYYKYLMNQRRLKQPIGEKNAGSLFKNKFELPCWKIIDLLNLRGYCINDAAISTKHANFIINKKDSTFFDMYKLINLIKEKAELLNYNLELELEIIKFS